MTLLKNRKLEVRLTNDKDQSTPLPEYAQQKLDAVNRAEDIQETIRIVSSHVILGVGTYLILDTFRKGIIKMLPAG